MYNDYRAVCVIPARGGSKGLPRKNMLEICGKPLIAYSIEQAKHSKYIDRILVSTDDDGIADVSKQYGAEVPFVRPAHLATDYATTIDVLLHAIDYLECENFEFDIIVLLHATAPLRFVADIDDCIKKLVEEQADNVFSVTPAHRNPYFNMVEVVEGRIVPIKAANFPVRQCAPCVYDLNASIYVWMKETLKREKSLYMDKSAIHIMPKERSVDIDDRLDFKLVRLLMEERDEQPQS